MAVSTHPPERDASAPTAGDPLASVSPDDLDALYDALARCALSWHRRRQTAESSQEAA